MKQIMEYQDGQHPIFPYTPEDKQEIRKELGLKDSTIEEDVETIYEWFQKQPHLIEAGIDRDFIERMLIIAKGSLEKTKRRIDNFYKYRGLAPEIIQNREKELDDFNNDIWNFFQVAMPPKLYKNKRITVMKFVDSDPSNFHVDLLFRTTFMLSDIRMKYDYMLGDIWILDIKNAVFGHLLRFNPMILQKTAHIFQDGLGQRIFAIHILNAPAMGNQILNLMKQFFNPKIIERVVSHPSLEDLYKSIPKRYLPKDYGGEEPSMDEFKEKYQKELRSEGTKQFLYKCSKLVSNESKRPGGNIHEEYLAGSFKKLDLD